MLFLADRISKLLQMKLSFGFNIYELSTLKGQGNSQVSSVSTLCCNTNTACIYDLTNTVVLK